MIAVQLESDRRAISFSLNGNWIYEVDLDTCNTISDYLDWIRQLVEKTWMDKPTLAVVVNCMIAWHEARNARF